MFVNEPWLLNWMIKEVTDQPVAFGQTLVHGSSDVQETYLPLQGCQLTIYFRILTSHLHVDVKLQAAPTLQIGDNKLQEDITKGNLLL